MTSKLAACEPCRRSKLACDHKTPICSRCRSRNKASSCTYRASPFKRRKPNEQGLETSSLDIAVTEVELSQPSVAPNPSPAQNVAIPISRSASSGGRPVESHRLYRYPNPGFQGSSSHATIFSQFQTPENLSSAPGISNTRSSMATGSLRSPTTFITRGAEILKRIREDAILVELESLVKTWMSTGINMALAGPFLPHAMQSLLAVFSPGSLNADWDLEYAEIILNNSLSPFNISSSTKLPDFVNQFNGSMIRWETIAIVFAGVVRATVDVHCFVPLYTTDNERLGIQKKYTDLADQCLELSLSLDSLNEIQLLVHYENWIMHTFVDGDQSYHSWRKLGDVTSTLFALGYHENIANLPGAPAFLTDLRKAAFAQVYAADKNVAIFLGRPPRINKRFCCFQVPSGTHHSSGSNSNEWAAEAPIDNVADTRRSAFCAALKEDILELFRSADTEKQTRKAKLLELRVEDMWQGLPKAFRLESTLKEYNGTHFERDFVALTRLDYLQILFLLQLMLARRHSESNIRLRSISQDILSLTVEMVVLRNRIINSGCGLIWKLAYYGLPAAGIISLELLKDPSSTTIFHSKSIRDLTVLVAEIEDGGIVQPGEPNYALLLSAASTMHSVLDVVASSQHHQTLTRQPDATDAAANTGTDWHPWMNPDSWEFELDFWNNLAGHPSLIGQEIPIPT